MLKPTYGPAHVLLFISWFLAMLGLPGLYARQAHRAGKLGLVAFALLMLATAYHLYLLLYEAFATPVLAQAEPDLIGDGPMAHGVETLAMVAAPVLLAFPLFGIATLRAAVLPRWTGWLQIASVPVFFLGMFLPTAPFVGSFAFAEPIRLMYYTLFLGFAGGGDILWGQQDRGQALVPSRVATEPAT